MATTEQGHVTVAQQSSGCRFKNRWYRSSRKPTTFTIVLLFAGRRDCSWRAPANLFGLVPLRHHAPKCTILGRQKSSIARDPGYLSSADEGRQYSITVELGAHLCYKPPFGHTSRSPMSMVIWGRRGVVCSTLDVAGRRENSHLARLRIQMSPVILPRAYSSCLPSREICGSSRKSPDSGKSVALTGSSGFHPCAYPGTR